jgi:hypothetical protein
MTLPVPAALIYLSHPVHIPMAFYSFWDYAAGKVMVLQIPCSSGILRRV